MMSVKPPVTARNEHSARYDIVICGLGPVGAVAANLLGQFGLSVLAVEHSSRISGKLRAVHFDGEVMRIFQSIGLAGRQYAAG